MHNVNLIGMLSTLLFLSLSSPVLSTSQGRRMELTHVDSGTNFTKLELLERMVIRSKIRAEILASKIMHRTNPPTIPAHISNGEYLINLYIGTPSQPLALTLDTGSDLIWTQCQPCLKCFDQPFLIYNPSKSSTYADLPCYSNLCKALPYSTCRKHCLYQYSYGDGSTTMGTLGSETFTLGSTTIPNIGFGCGDRNTGIFESHETGIAGFGRGQLSLVSQLGYSKFSYCFTSVFELKSSPVLFGDTAFLSANINGHVQSTPLVTNPSQPTFYYLSLNGITVGTTILTIPKSTFALKGDGSGGTIIDSGTSMTYLPEQAYKQVLLAFLSQVKLPVVNGNAIEGVDLCFKLPSNSYSSSSLHVPRFVFQFEGADLNLPLENYMYEDQSNGLLCLMMGESIIDETTIIGNYQQQNIHVLYDLAGGKLSFVHARCDQL